MEEKSAADLQILRAGEMMSDPTVSEEDKNKAALLIMFDQSDKFKKSDDFQKFSAEWAEVQIPLMTALRFEGSIVKTYNPHIDNLSGAYLEYVTGSYIINIDAEDAQSMDEIDNMGYLAIKIFKDNHSKSVENGESQTDGDMIELIADGCILNIEVGKQICQTLKEGDEATAISLIKTYHQLIEEDLIPK